ncbi:Dabb family protein [Roseiconus nitratireducens]|uniref:Dabb family protein n=1 Tax=Roseiconus nitratireducens TaxID=2605748 RepID=UPI001F474093|nr:Dabb family protein [Roseiconus nitratireducens]
MLPRRIFFRIALIAGFFCLAAGPGCFAQNDDASQSENAVTGDPTETAGDSAESQKKGLLRHAVFFSFKDSASEADVQEVVDVFAALPSKIDSIIDFQYGTNNSPEGLDDGFTHCFLLTFADEAGRKEYLPHAAHKAFGDVLRPHMKDVFVLDYWGDPSQPKPEKSLLHAVFFDFKDDASPEKIKQVEEAFAALPEKIDTIRAFEWGTNNSPESHDDGFTHCFLVTFDSEEGRAAYLPHPDHQAFVDVLKPVLEKARVLDFWAAQP